MKTVLCVIILMLCLILPVYAEIFFDYGFVLLDGEDYIVMAPGETIYLRVTHSFWHTPVLTGLEYSSKAPGVAYVDRSGWIHAGMPGRTVISVWNDSGDNGTLEVFVRGEIRAPVWISMGIAAAALIFLLLRYKNHSLN